MGNKNSRRALAHSPNKDHHSHDLVDHLTAVAHLAKQFADKFDAGDLAYWAGLWHDLGKFHPDFQTYLANPSTKRGPDHSSAGAILATECFDPLAFLIAGHHGGLPCMTDLKSRVRKKAKAPPIQEALDIARDALENIKPVEALQTKLPEFLHMEVQTTRQREMQHRRLELFLRMVFSALVDGDFLDTECHFHPERSKSRKQASGIDILWKQLEENQVRFIADIPDDAKDKPVNAIRREIYEACVQAASEKPGIFTLTVPTGGGKTRSGMAFGLKHAVSHGLDRVIVAIPYTSIIEQTADVYRGIFGDTTVLEHHSGVTVDQEPRDPLSGQDVWPRLASQNWDAPIVVTTTVQLFESLFANKPSKCRKLHNIARSVLILDEVQTLPPGLLEPILDILQELADHYSVSIVLCTATQPTLQDKPYLKGLKDKPSEIVPNPVRYFDALKRVQYELPLKGEQWTWQRVAEEMQKATQCLTVVNTKRDALHLLDALDDPTALHLSTLLCGAHRRDVLQQVRRRLQNGKRCQLVSTQVIEAGVDLDFPLVLRAVGPLDRIIQAAGRCNREGRLKAGRVVIFHPQEGSTPPGCYRTGTETTLGLLNRSDADLHNPSFCQVYFEGLYQARELDEKRIQNLRAALDYTEVARRFRLIDDDSTPVIVRPKYMGSDQDKINNLLSIVRQQEALPRWALRRLQPYLVNIKARLIPQYYKEGLVSEVAPGLWEWLGKYDSIRGLVVANRDPEDLVI